MSYPDPIPGPQVVVRDGQIFYRAFGETTWFYISPDRAERQAEAYEATLRTHWAYARERELASQYRVALADPSIYQQEQPA